MADINDVIKGFEQCWAKEPNTRNCGDCPYKQYLYDGRGKFCADRMHLDALELLKEQVKTEVVFKEYDGILESECGNCGQHLDKAYSNCPKCNKALDWNKNQS